MLCQHSCTSYYARVTLSLILWFHQYCKHFIFALVYFQWYKPTGLCRQSVDTSACLLVSKCLRRAAPSYLTDLCVPVSATTTRPSLRSSSRGDLMIPRCRLSRYGSRSFAVCGPAAWNSLPAAVRDFFSSSSSSCFYSHLKTELFCRAYGVDSP